jgi:hypothetical protein
MLARQLFRRDDDCLLFSLPRYGLAPVKRLFHRGEYGVGDARPIAVGGTKTVVVGEIGSQTEWREAISGETIRRASRRGRAPASGLSPHHSHRASTPCRYSMSLAISVSPRPSRSFSCRDNLNTHKPTSLCEAFMAPEVWHLERCEGHSTPTTEVGSISPSPSFAILSSQRLERSAQPKPAH